jgi:hypothetical protein
MSGFKKESAGMYYIINPDVDRIDIFKSGDGKGWIGAGQRYSSLSSAKAEIAQKIRDGGSGYSKGGLSTKKYVNPVTITDNRKNK